MNKVIPPGSGLGAGSANAAAVLYGLNRMFDMRLTETELIEIGARIGADVPFFLKGGLCRVSGVGEQVTEVSGGVPYRFMIVIPEVRIPTRLAYRWWDENPHWTEMTSAEFLRLLAKSGEVNYYNSFEPVITARYREIADILGMIRSAGLVCGISGSGSALFVLYRSEDEVRKLDYEIRKHTDKIFYANATDRGVLEID